MVDPSSESREPGTRSVVGGCQRVVGLASIWTLDDALGRYRRMPKMECPRERPDWGDARAGTAEDFVWHPMDDWFIADGGRRLVLVPTDGGAFWAPLCAEVDGTMFDVDGAVEDHDPELYERRIQRQVERALELVARKVRQEGNPHRPSG